jgi:hypothetical protein
MPFNLGLRFVSTRSNLKNPKANIQHNLKSQSKPKPASSTMNLTQLKPRSGGCGSCGH